MPSTTADAAEPAPTRPGATAGDAAPPPGAGRRVGTPTLDDAIALAARMHAGQLDRAGEEYIGHPLRVMTTVARTAPAAGLDPTAAQIAAVLHDVVEDSELGLADLAAAGYPSEIVTAVDALSHREGESTLAYLVRVAADPLAVVVKRADLQDNGDPARLRRLAPEFAERLATRYAERCQLLDELVAAAARRAVG